MKPLAYLLKLLGITHAELGAAIYVDRSVVSKWASGRQRLGAKSRHYGNVIAYLQRVNEKQGGSRLERFFAEHFPDAELSLSDYLELFLEEEQGMSLLPQMVNQAPNMRYSDVKISGKIGGRYQALMDMLDEACCEKKHQHEVILFDRHNFSWLEGDAQMVRALHEKLCELLELGHRLCMISEEHSVEQVGVMIGMRINLYRYKNFHEFFHKASGLLFEQSYYLLKGESFVCGQLLPGGQMYTLILRDEGSVQAAERNAQLHLQRSVPYQQMASWSQMYEALSLIDSVASNDDTLYMHTPSLSFADMSKELLDEILQQNKVSHERSQMLLRLSAINRESLGYAKSNTYSICYRSNVERMLTAEEYCMEDLTVLAGKPVWITRAQVRRHVYDTVACLRLFERYELVFLPECLPLNQGSYCFLVKKNHYLMSANRTMRIVQDYSLINSITEALDKQRERLVREGNEERESVIRYLEWLVQKDIELGGKKK